jgi:hypothetical protein
MKENMIYDHMMYDYIRVSEDYLLLNVCVGRAKKVSDEIRAGCSDSPYMNGYCWSAMLQNYLEDKGKLTLSLEFWPNEDSLQIFLEKENPEGSTLYDVASAIIAAIEGDNVLFNWICETGFSYWDEF